MNEITRLIKRLEELRIMSYINNKKDSHYDYSEPIRNIMGKIHLHGDLGMTDLRGADLRGADLRGSDLRHVDLRGADLRGADLRDIYLWTDQDLQGLDLRGADLRGVDFDGVDLRHVDLRGADLRSADLRGTALPDNIQEANIEYCIFGYNTNKSALKGADNIFIDNIIDEIEWKVSDLVQYNIGPKPEVYESMIMSMIASYNSYDKDLIVAIIKEQILEIEELLSK